MPGSRWALEEDGKTEIRQVMELWGCREKVGLLSSLHLFWMLLDPGDLANLFLAN